MTDPPVAQNEDLIRRLQLISLHESAESVESSSSRSRCQSQYRMNFRPIAEGLRKRLWEEGWKYRKQRKEDGFNHFRLEWRPPSDRRVRSGNRRLLMTRRASDAGAAKLEYVMMPLTKLERKQRRLSRMYRKRKSIADTEGKDQEEDVHPRHNEDDQGEALNSYERNKANNMRSNIVLVTAMSNNSSNDDGEESFGDAKVSSGVVNNTVRSDVYTCKKSEEDMTKAHPKEDKATATETGEQPGKQPGRGPKSSNSSEKNTKRKKKYGQ